MPANLATAPFILIPQYFGSTVFDRSTSKYLPFDAETTELLRQSKIQPFFTLIDSLPTHEKQTVAGAFFEHFYSLGFFDLEGYFTGEILEAIPAEDHMTGPLAVHLEIMAACNLTCTHCFAGELPRRDTPLTLPEMEILFRDMAGMGSFRLGLTGGEPLLRRDLFDIIDLATNYGLHPCLTTNGLLITEDIAREFGKRKLVWLNVSLDGATPDSNDRVRGAGTFNRVLEKLRILADHTRFTLAFTILRTNAAEVEACAELAHQVGASTAVFRPLYPVGIAAQHLDELMPTFAQYTEALAALTDMTQNSGGDLRTIDPFSPHLRTESQAITHTNHGCGAGNLVCSISVSGEVNPCSFLGAGFVAANIRHTHLPEIWHHSQVFQAIRALPGGTADTFSGGCRARSLAFNGDANAPDTWLQSTTADTPRSPNVTFYDPLTILELTHSG